MSFTTNPTVIVQKHYTEGNYLILVENTREGYRTFFRLDNEPTNAELWKMIAKEDGFEEAFDGIATDYDGSFILDNEGIPVPDVSFQVTSTINYDN